MLEITDQHGKSTGGDATLRPLAETTADAAKCVKIKTIATADGNRVLCLFNDGTASPLVLEP